MFKKDIYKYKDEKGRTMISPYKPNVEYEHMYRLIARSDEYRLTNYSMVTQVVDIEEKDLELWFEVHKDDLETPISQLEEINMSMQSLAKIGKLVANQVTDDVVALTIQEFYDVWAANVNYVKGQYINHEAVLYKVLQDHMSQADWTPNVSPSLFAKVLIDPSGETIPEWVQPDSTNAYMIGDKVKFEGHVYESIIDNNIWSPSAYPAGWKVID